MISEKIKSAIESVEHEYSVSTEPWYLGYSGGKDSTAVLKIIYNVMMESKMIKPIHVVYCDTGVEMPAIRDFVVSTMGRLNKEAEADGLPIYFDIVSPKIEETYFVNVIGRGYVPPTYRFRWCTDRLRIKPMQRFMASVQDKIVVLGTRYDESAERKRVMEKHHVTKNFFAQKGYAGSRIYSPIVDFSNEDVWTAIKHLKKPYSIDTSQLTYLYTGIAGGPDELSGKGRFGCWICTVVRKDRAGEELQKKGFSEMTGLLSFREKLISMRDDDSMRESIRRNGRPGKGPFTLVARRMLFDELLKTQNELGMSLIEQREIEEIFLCWEKDKGNE